MHFGRSHRDPGVERARLREVGSARLAAGLARSGPKYTVLLSFAAALALSFACASPTLPLPPPGYPSLAGGADPYHVVLASACGGVEPWAIVVIINENAALPSNERGSVAFADGCGAWGATVYAQNGDWLEIWQESDTSRSSSVAVPVNLP